MSLPKPYYQDGAVTIYHGDSREVWPSLPPCEAFVVDPPYDANLWYLRPWPAPSNSLVFCDPRNLSNALSYWGFDVRWLFVWDRMNQWNTGPKTPLQQTGLCLWYGTGQYNRDGVLWGDAPPARNHPTTKQKPLDGRRLVDLYRSSSRWLHNRGAGSGRNGTSRFGKRVGSGGHSHEKPLEWVRCLIGNCTQGIILDPFMGSGTTLRAAKDLGRKAIGVEIEERYCEIAAKRCAQEVMEFGS